MTIWVMAVTPVRIEGLVNGANSLEWSEGSLISHEKETVMLYVVLIKDDRCMWWD